MAKKIKFKRGNKADLPTLAEGEPGFVLDEKRLYIGHPDGNVEVPPMWTAGTADIEAGSASTEKELSLHFVYEE